MLSCSCHGFRGTILNAPITMTSLACGVSLKTVSKYVRGRKKRKSLEHFYVKQMTIMENYLDEWGVVVRHFVNDELKIGIDVTVFDLYSKICYAYADFPMSEAEFLKFLKTLGFSFRQDGEKGYVMLKLREPKTEIQKPEGELHEPKSEGVEKL